jgi:uncharacterized protein (TIGR02186 family)
MLRRLALLIALASPAAAQETLVTGVSTDTVALDVTFDGSEMFVFGAIRREAPIPSDTAPLDVIITIKGPAEPAIVRRKERVFGIWINTAAVRVRNAPSFYAVASTRPVQRILTETERLRYGIGLDQAVRLVGSHPEIIDTQDFAAALARIRLDRDLYSVLEQGVRLTEDTLFQASFSLPANLVEGDYAAEIFLVRGKEVISSNETTITVVKTGIERWIYNLAHDRPLAYGALAIALALFSGWLAAAAFSLVRR